MTTRRSPITTHVLDTALGRPAQGVGARLERQTADGGWAALAHGQTDRDGRIADLLEPEALELGTYRLVFDTGAYMRGTGRPVFYPYVSVVFQIEREGHYHVPLLLSPFGYSTYRGS